METLQSFAPPVNPIGLSVTLFMGVLLVILPRRYALLPVFFLTCYMTMGQRVMLSGLNFTMVRILMLFGLARLLLRREFRQTEFHQIDGLLLCYTVTTVLMHTLLWQTWAAFRQIIFFLPIGDLLLLPPFG